MPSYSNRDKSRPTSPLTPWSASATSHSLRVISLVVVWIGAILVGGATCARASDYANIKSPIFVGVERVFIYVEYISVTDHDRVPEVIQRDAIEQELLAIYRERFSAKECANSLRGKNPYECNDQPITLVSDADASNFIMGRTTSFATAEEISDPGTLNVIARFHITDGLPWFEPPLQSPLLSYYVIQDRPGSRIPITWWVSSERVIPINQNEDKIRDRLRTDLRGNIN